MLYNIATAALLILCKCLFKLKVKGKDSFPKKTPFILTSNHISNLDPVILGVAAFPRGVSFLAKEELFSNKLFALILKDVGAIPLKRGKSDIRTVRIALKTLKKRPLVVFPQGTRSSGFDKVNSGVGFLYRKAKVPIIAAKIQGTDKVLPRGAKYLSRGRVKVTFSKVDDIIDSDNYKDIASKVMNKIKTL